MQVTAAAVNVTEVKIEEIIISVETGSATVKYRKVYDDPDVVVPLKSVVVSINDIPKVADVIAWAEGIVLPKTGATKAAVK